jgi:hypothetical protein
MSLLACALALCLSDSTLAQQNISAQSISVRSMYDDCKGRNLEYCDGFLLAIAQGLEMLSTYHPKFAEEYCPPPVTDPASYRKIFIDWADFHRLGRPQQILESEFIRRSGCCVLDRMVLPEHRLANPLP